VPTSARGCEPRRSIITPVGPHHQKLRYTKNVASNQRTHITMGLGARQAGLTSQHMAHCIKKVRNPAVGTSQQAAQSTEAMGSRQ